MKRFFFLIFIFFLLVSCKEENTLKIKIDSDIQERYAKENEITSYTADMKVVGMISKYTGDPFLDNLMLNCKLELSNAGIYSLLKSPDSYLDPIEEQFDILNEFIISEVDGIIITPNHEIALNDLIAKATRQGIYVVIVDTPVDLDDLREKETDFNNLTFVLINNFDAAFEALKTYGDTLDSSLNCLLINGDLNNPNAIDRMVGFKEAIEVSPYLNLVSEAEGSWQENLAYEVVLSELDSTNNIDLIVCANDRMAFGAIEAINKVGLSKEILVSGFDGTLDGLEMVAAGKMEFTVSQCPEEFGRIASEVMLSLMNGNIGEFKFIDSTLQMRGDLDDKLD